MDVRFPLKDVDVRLVAAARTVKVPLYADSYWQMNQLEFAMQVEGVADFYACEGREVEYAPVDGADRNSIELYLNGSVYGAILHQRKILPMHGSSFIYTGLGVMICGEAGAGKSSLTASFCLNGAGFLTDDITPVIFSDNIPYIWAMSDRIKLWSDTLRQLEMEDEELPRVFPDSEKFYFPMDSAGDKTCRLEQILIVTIRRSGEVVIDELTGSAKFSALRGEIYRCEYLPGMPENEPVYFRNLVDICNTVRIFRVRRPEEIRVGELMTAVRRQIAGEDV